VRALVVDDSATVRRRLLAMLAEFETIEAIEADDAGDALLILACTEIHVVILDLCLRERRAFELIGQIKATYPKTAVVILTNDVGEAQRRECLQRGADHFFDKSLQFERALAIAVGCSDGD
jgi:DNA-binding NarL/FixJ family response regulator